MAITFLDKSTVKLTEWSKLLIDEYIYDPDPSKAKMALTFGLGTARFITGNLNRIDKQNISLKTPTANIAIRGTDFTATVDELGRSLIILLPDPFGLSSGEIEVVTAMGTVILNKPYEATTVSVFESAPTKPVILDLTLDIIDNMLIVSPPKEEALVQEETTTTKADSVLDFNDPDTQITALITGNVVSLRRQVNESVRVDVNGSNAYTVILIQDGVSNVIKINGGSDSIITITQSD